MNSTSDNNQLLSSNDNYTSMDLGNSFDYVHDYYINSYDYILDSTASLVDDLSHNEGCKVVSSNDSIDIIHNNGTNKHIEKKKYVSASKKYNEKKAAKAKVKAQNKAKTARSTSHAYINHFNTPNNTKTTNTSHQEIFGNNNTVKRTSTGTIKLIIFLFVILPYIASIFFSCVGEIFDL